MSSSLLVQPHEETSINAWKSVQNEIPRIDALTLYIVTSNVEAIAVMST